MNTIKKAKSGDKVTMISKPKYNIEDDVPLMSAKFSELKYPDEIALLKAMKIGQSFKFPVADADKFKMLQNFACRTYQQLFTIKKIDSYNLRIWKIDYSLRGKKNRRKKLATV